jgi:hypothetical protein
LIRRTAERHLPGVRLQRAGEDAHERALAGPVLADERAYFSGRDPQTDGIDGHGAAEHLSDPAHLEPVYFNHLDRSGESRSFISG